jgi:hypothetical protein
MTLELLYLAGCPNHEATLDLVHSVLEAEGMPAKVRRILIRNAADACRHGFPGSPTVRVNGRDIEDVSSPRVAVGFACRAYFGEGKLQNIPPRSWLEHAIRKAQEQETHR